MAASDPRKRAEFEDLAVPLLDRVYTVALYLTKNQHEAEDLLQETFARAYRFWHQFTPGTNCKAWLMTILHNNFRNRYRERQRQQHTVEFDETGPQLSDVVNAAAAEKTPEDLVLSQMLDGEVEAALKSLPGEFLEAILLVDLQELSYEEAAGVLDCPIGTVRSRLSRGRRLLQAALQQYAEEHGYFRRSDDAVR
jgi:RNA polymerase sigma-70 factor (ECF subfamily)